MYIISEWGFPLHWVYINIDKKNVPLNALAVHILGNASKYLWYISVENQFLSFLFSFNINILAYMQGQTA